MAAVGRDPNFKNISVVQAGGVDSMQADAAASKVGKASGHKFSLMRFLGIGQKRATATADELSKKDLTMPKAGDAPHVEGSRFDPEPKLGAIDRMKACFARLLGKPVVSGDLDKIEKFYNGKGTMKELMETREGELAVRQYAKKTYNLNTINFHDACVRFEKDFKKELKTGVGSKQMLEAYKKIVEHFITDDRKENLDQINIASKLRAEATTASATSKPATLITTLNAIHDSVFSNEKDGFNSSQVGKTLKAKYSSK